MQVQGLTVAFQLLKMTVAMLILSHIAACGFFAVAKHGQSGRTSWLEAQGLDKSSGPEQYVAAFYFAIATGTTVGYGDIHPENFEEQIFTIFLLVSSVAYIGHFLARVSQMVSSLRHIETQMMQAKRDAMLFMKKRAVPKELQLRVLRYIDHVYETDAVTSLDTKVLGLLSESLQMQLALAVTGSILKQFPLFEDSDDGFVTALCQVCRTTRAGVGDVVVARSRRRWRCSGSSAERWRFCSGGSRWVACAAEIGSGSSPSSSRARSEPRPSAARPIVSLWCFIKRSFIGALRSSHGS